MVAGSGVAFRLTRNRWRGTGEGRFAAAADPTIAAKPRERTSASRHQQGGEPCAPLNRSERFPAV